MKTYRYTVFAILVIILLIGLDVKQASDKSEMLNSYSDNPPNVETPPSLQKVLTDATPPRTPTDLKELVLDLLDATPLANRTDYDGDWLYDPVEAVIGTDPKSNDTDADGLSDYYEVMNGTDPILPDSNYDGLFDYNEISVELDLDNDGIPNTWDFDNDDDGVNDRSDLSPYAKSIVSSSFNISIHTTGSPTFITFQVIPQNPEHLRFVYQSWDWLLYDTEGQMQDFDGSKNDLELVPYLHLKTDAMPGQSDLDTFGVLDAVDGVSIPLSPVYEFDNIVAFNGRLLYAENIPSDIVLEAELVWQVVGYTDVTASILKANDNYVSIGNDGIAVANTSDAGDALVLEWITIRESSTIEKVAIKILDGPYLSVSEDNRTLGFTGTSIGERETFSLYKYQGWLMGYNLNFTSILPDGTMVLQEYGRAIMEIIDTVHTSPTNLVKYTEPFMLTGIVIEEFHGTSVGIFYNVTDKNQTIAAQWLMNYKFVNNATTTISDMPNLLQDNNINVSFQSQPVNDKYDGFIVLSEELIPDALYLHSGDEAVPIIIAMEDNTTIIDMAEGISGSYILSGPFTVDLTGKVMQTSKSLKMNWYNSTTYIGLCPTEIIAEVITWGADSITTYNLVTVLLRWNTGEYKITKQQLYPMELDEFDPLELELASNIAMSGIAVLELGGTFVSLLRNWKHLKWLQGGEIPATMLEITDYLAKWSKGAWGKSALVKSVGKNSKILGFCKYQDSLSLGCRSGKFVKFFKTFNDVMFVIGIVVEIGLSIAAGVMIADQIGGSAGRAFGTTYAILALIVGLWMIGTLAVIAAIPVIGWLIALGIGIADACGDYSQGMITHIVGKLFGAARTFAFVTPNAYVKDIPTVTVLDSDYNGVDLGDTILVNGTLWNEIDVVVKYVRMLGEYFDDNIWSILLRMTAPEYYPINEDDLNFILPFVDVIGPLGSNSMTSLGAYGDPSTLLNLVLAYLWGTLPLEGFESETYGEYTTVGRDRYHADHYVFAREYAYAAWITPGIAQPNFPVTTRLSSVFIVSNFWWHCPVWMFGSECYHRDWFSNFTQYNIITDYYDVFPGSLDDFLDWRWISPNDYDGDGLNNTEEASTGTSWLDFDSDGDGLDDKYETEHGYNALAYDTDLDGVTDWFEHVYETNVTNTDSDEDGLDDYTEISGWIVSFNYLGNESLPFQIPVTSNPNNNDSDSDGIYDLIEYQSNTNPRSNDTNGDGTPDLQYAWFTSEVAYETYTDWTMDGDSNKIMDICVDEYGYVYANGILDSVSGNNTIRKYDSSLTQVTLPSSSVFNNMTFLPSGSRLLSMAIDESNDWLYAQVAPLFSNNIVRFNLSGTVVNPGSWTPILNKNITDLDFGTDGTIYAAVRDTGDDQIGGFRTYSSDGSALATYGNRGPAADQCDWITSMAVDYKYGWVYLCDKQFSYGKTDRVVKLRLSDGAYAGTLAEDYVSILDIDVDSDGCVYVLGELSDGMCVQKFYPNGVEDVDFRFYGNGALNFTTGTYAIGSESHQLAVGPDKSIYVLDWVTIGIPSTSRIWKFSQTVTLNSELVPDTNPDWDNDGLSNTQEIDGWDITVNFTLGEQTFQVTSNHLMNDSDLDGLGDYMEFTLGSNPNAPDTDLDGVSDHKEWWITTYPGVDYIPPMQPSVFTPSTVYTNHMSWAPAGPSLTDWDSDGDLLRDGIELAFGSSPVNPDSDGDGLSDLTEFLYNSNPNSADTDNDGADDAQEVLGNSSLLSADSDNDLIFDGAEYDMGTNATYFDSDGDGIPDGYEMYYEIDPMSNDTDNDGVSDANELILWLNPRSNDTDQDGIPDGVELAIGSSPWNVDSDYDGIPDGADTDTFAEWEGPVVLVIDPDISNDALGFVTTLEEYAEVVVVSVEELLDNYADSPYVVLVGRPDSDSNSVTGLMYDLLTDTGDTLTGMMEEDSRDIAIRFGVWTETQTVLMLSSAFPEDVFLVLQNLRGRNVTIRPDSVLLEYQTLQAVTHGSIAFAIVVNEIDTVRVTDSILTIYLSGAARLDVQITKFNATTTPHELTYTTGLHVNEVSLGIYLEISISLYETTTDVFEAALVQIYYKESDLDRNDDGIIGQMGDVNETSLCIYVYNETSDSWTKITENLEWVLDLGLNTTDVEIYGESYAGFIWIQVTHISMYGLAGQLLFVDVVINSVVIVIVGIIAIVGVMVVFRRKRKGVSAPQTGALVDSIRE